MGPKMATTFHILIKNDGRVNDPDNRKTLSLSAGDQVRWVAAGGGPFTIVFTPDSPFPGNNFPVSVGNPYTSGPASNGVIDRRYKYQVFDRGVKVDDPDILIES
jgi:hypothetical protein